MITDAQKRRAEEIVSGYLWSDPVAESVRDEIALALAEAVAAEREKNIEALDAIVDDHYNNHDDPKICPNGGNECSVEIFCEFAAKIGEKP